MTSADTPLREQLEFADTDTPLRDDVRRLGAMVGDMLAEQVAPVFLEQVETLRRIAIARREQGEPVDALAQRLAQVPLAQLVQITSLVANYAASSFSSTSKKVLPKEKPWI